MKRIVEICRGAAAAALVGVAVLAAGAAAAQDEPAFTAALTPETSEHDGSSVFRIGLAFSEEPAWLSYRTVREALFTVTGGTLFKAKRDDAPLNRNYTLHLRPHGTGPVTLARLGTLPACGAPGAVCAPGGRALSGTLSVTVPGPASPPGAPQALRASPGIESVVLTWDEPASDGNRAIERYEYRYAAGAAVPPATPWRALGEPGSAGSLNRRQEVTGLSAGLAYIFEVRAVNGAAAGPPEVATVTVPVPEPPGAPQDLDAAASPGTVVLTWEAPASDGGVGIERYEYRYAAGAAVPPATPWRALGEPGSAGALNRRQEVTGLSNGLAYAFEVRAVNGASAGPPAAATVTVPVPEPPGAPRNLQATVLDNGFLLTWDAPASDGNVGIERYEYRMAFGALLPPTPYMSWSSLTRPGSADSLNRRQWVSVPYGGTPYTLGVRAVNVAGAGPPAYVTQTMPGSEPQLPAAPRNLRVVPGDSSAVLRWDPPETAGSFRLEQYQYRYATGGPVPEGTPWNAFANHALQYRGASHEKIVGLTNGSAHTLEMRAVSVAGGGPPAVTTFTPRAVPCPAPDFAGRTKIWSATVEIGPGDAFGQGYIPSPTNPLGALSDPTFDLESGSHSIRELSWTGIFHGEVYEFSEDSDATDVEFDIGTAGTLLFGLDPGLSAADVARLTLHVCDEAYPLISARGYDGGDGQEVGEFYLQAPTQDWSLVASRTVYLSVPEENDAPARTVRLVGGEEAHEGRLEIFHAGQWGSVCDDYWGQEDADVACRSLGYEAGSVDNAKQFRRAYFGAADETAPIWLDNLQCTGSEESLLACPRARSLEIGEHNCRHREDVGVRCKVPALLSVADAEAQEGPGAALDFVVTLSRARSEATTVAYATADVTATAGEDYRETSGTLAFAAGVTERTVSVAVLDDAHDEGTETLTLTLSDPSPASYVRIADGTATGTIGNDDPMPQAWIARFGRTVAEQVLEAVEGRMRAARAAGAELSLAGQRIGLGPVFGGAGEPSASEDRAAAEAEGAGRRLADWLADGSDEGGAQRRLVSGRELLTGSAFALTAAPGGSGGTMALWGRGAVSRFDGRAGDLALDGEVVSGLLGGDWSPGSGTATLGLIVGHSRGEGGWRSASGGGTVVSTLTGVYPWVRRALTERLEVWGAAGYGEGTLTLTPEAGTAARAGLDLMMGAAGVRGVVLAAPAGGPEVTVTADAMGVAVTTARAPDLAAAEADVTRLRLGLEGTWPVRLERGASLTPSLALGVRHDGGDAETGYGADVGGGIAWSDPGRGLMAEVRGRGLLSHEASGLRERGISGALSWEPDAGGRGPRLSLTQTLGGASEGGIEALHGRRTLTGLAADGDELRRRRLEARLGYGFSAFGDGFTLTPEAGAGLSDAGRDYTLSWRLSRRGGGDAGSLELALEARRQESANDNGPPRHELGLRIHVRW